MRGAISPRLLEVEGQASVGQLGQRIVRDGRTREVLDEAFEAVALVGARADGGVDVEAEGRPEALHDGEATGLTST